MKTLSELLVHELKDLYDAEHQLTKALPKMIDATKSSELKTAFKDHLKETQTHIERLELVFEQLGEKPARTTCDGMKGLLKEGEMILEEEMDPVVRDAALIGAAQRVEHYEMAGYGTARTFAMVLGHHDAAHLLQQTLDNEEVTDKKLSGIANKINLNAVAE